MAVKRRKIDPRFLNISSITVKHPLGVKPQGNSLLSDLNTEYETRKRSLGVLSILPDEVLQSLFQSIKELSTLKSLLYTSKYLYVFLSDEELWKKWYLSNTSSKLELEWKGSWKQTVINQPDLNFQVNFNSDIIYRPFQVSNINYMKLFHNLIQEETHNKAHEINLPGRIPRYKTLSIQDFEATSDPFILTNEEWPKWSLERLHQQFGNVKFQQESVNWTLNNYLKYLRQNQDENPLYLFDCHSTAMKHFKNEYKVPEIFQKDYFKLLGDSRPDHSWLIIGGARSGSTFHKDPNNTCAWNACISGMKLWVMLPPSITPPGVMVDADESEVTSPVGIGEWVLSGFYNDVIKLPETLVGITFPGECMYVPSNWWHLVINLQDSIAITENFVPNNNLTNVLKFFKEKPNQISGFKLNDINELIKKVSVEQPSIEKFKMELQESSFDLFEDCGEIDNLPDIPIFDIFQELLRANGDETQLNKSLEELNSRSKTSISKWTSLTNDTNCFKFDFLA